MITLGEPVDCLRSVRFHLPALYDVLTVVKGSLWKKRSTPCSYPNPLYYNLIPPDHPRSHPSRCIQHLYVAEVQLLWTASSADLFWPQPKGDFAQFMCLIAGGPNLLLTLQESPCLNGEVSKYVLCCSIQTLWDWGRKPSTLFCYVQQSHILLLQAYRGSWISFSLGQWGSQWLEAQWLDTYDLFCA